MRRYSSKNINYDRFEKTKACLWDLQKHLQNMRLQAISEGNVDRYLRLSMSYLAANFHRNNNRSCMIFKESALCLLAASTDPECAEKLIRFCKALGVSPGQLFSLFKSSPLKAIESFDQLYSAAAALGKTVVLEAHDLGNGKDFQVVIESKATIRNATSALTAWLLANSRFDPYFLLLLNKETVACTGYGTTVPHIKTLNAICLAYNNCLSIVVR